MIRKVFVWLHRWLGLAMALFLVVEGITGSLLAFNPQLTRLFDPRLFADPPEPGAKLLDPASLAKRVKEIAPQAYLAHWGRFREDQVVLRCKAERNPATGKRYDIDFGYLVLDPYTGKELGRLKEGGYAEGILPNVMPFVYELHRSLALGGTGSWILAILAIVWTVDCFIGLYLTWPTTWRNFIRRWGRAWLIKWRGGAFRLNFDLHRAGGLWLWPLLLVFAWSSVNLLDVFGVFRWVTPKLFGYQESWSWDQSHPGQPVEHPALDWKAAQAAGEKLAHEQAAAHGFKVVKPVSLDYSSYQGLYHYTIQTDRILSRDHQETVIFDANTGALAGAMSSWDERLGNTVELWLESLHTIKDPVDYVTYRWIVCVVGLGIVMLSATGIYIWWKKFQARRFAAATVRARRQSRAT